MTSLEKEIDKDFKAEKRLNVALGVAGGVFGLTLFGVLGSLFVCPPSGEIGWINFNNKIVSVIRKESCISNSTYYYADVNGKPHYGEVSKNGRIFSYRGKEFNLEY
ncbi:MAG: hypothetical protein AABW81_04275 [Nanoarchaeota archaeon]